MVSGIIHVYNISINFQFGNVFYCFVFTMVQGDFLGVLEVVAYDERLTQIDRGTICNCFPCLLLQLLLNNVRLEIRNNVNHGEWAIVRYIFHVMYKKIVFDVMDNENV